MLEVVLSIFVLCLAVVGLVEVFRAVALLPFNKNDIDSNAILLIPICGHNEEIEMILRNAISNAKWLSSMSNQKIVCLDLGMDAETKRICEIICEECELVEIYSLKDFNNAIEQSIV